MRTEPMAHQAAALAKIGGQRVGALFQEPGTGKTWAGLALAQRHQGRAPRVVWVCPVAARATIRHEVLKHTTLEGAQIYVFGDRTRPGQLPDARVYIVGTESVSSSDRVTLALAELIDDRTLLVLDESDMIRTPDSVRTLRLTMLGTRAWGRVILTGTPVPEGAQSLYAQMRFLDPRILGYRSWYAFAREHIEWDPEFAGRVRRVLNGDELARRVEPYVYRVSRDECLDLPAQVWDEWYMTPGHAQLEAYAAARAEFLDVPDDQLTRAHIYRLFTALQQIASGFWNRVDPVSGARGTLLFPNDRLDVLAAAVGRVPEDGKLIVWCKYLRSVQAVSARLAGLGVAQHHGEMTPAQRDAALAHWRRPGGARVLVGTPGTGGRALTLNEASNALFYERGFSYTENYQAELRNHRIGTARTVTYTDITSTLGIERRILEAYAEKTSVSALFHQQLKTLGSARATAQALVA